MKSHANNKSPSLYLKDVEGWVHKRKQRLKIILDYF